MGGEEGGGAEEGGMGRSSGEYVVRYIIIIVQNTLIVCLVVGATDYMPTTKHDPDKEGRQGCVGITYPHDLAHTSQMMTRVRVHHTSSSPQLAWYGEEERGGVCKEEGG